MHGKGIQQTMNTVIIKMDSFSLRDAYCWCPTTDIPVGVPVGEGVNRPDGRSIRLLAVTRSHRRSNNLLNNNYAKKKEKNE